MATLRKIVRSVAHRRIKRRQSRNVKRKRKTERRKQRKIIMRGGFGR